MEEPSHSEFDTCAEDQLIVQSSQHPEWFSQQQKPPSLDCDWNKTLPAIHGSIQPWISEFAKRSDSRSSFNELMDTPLDFFNFLINRFKVDTLTPELLAGPTYELMKGTCKSLVKLEYHLEEVFKATIDQLDWLIPKVSSIHTICSSLYRWYQTTEVIVLFHLSILSTTTSSISVEVPQANHHHPEACGRPSTGSQKLPEEAHLTKPDTYRSDLKPKEAYTTHSNPQGFIY
nr:hypothetical protein [Tanacetum cinerariifolium]